MDRVRETQRASPALSLHDCAAFVLAQREADCILLTGDRRLRSKAEGSRIECHGVLWAVEQIHAAGLTTAKTLIKALERWSADSTVRLPQAEITLLIARLKR
jgi:predicted nucleic acid-binding protein